MTIQSESILSFFSALTFALIVTACAGGQSSSVPAQSSSQDLDSLRVAIQQTIGEAAETPDSCRLIAFGSKPCGGPWQYLPYSIEATDSVTLAHLVDEYNSAEAKLNREQGRTSDCSVVQRPDLVLEEGHCSMRP
jgi:hypothetical protein